VALLFVGSGLRTRFPPTKERDFFEQQIRPIWPANAWNATVRKSRKGAPPDLAEELLKGGKSGPAAVEKKGAESLADSGGNAAGKGEMPPESKLRDDEVAALKKWVDIGLPGRSSPSQTAEAEGRDGHHPG